MRGLADLTRRVTADAAVSWPAFVVTLLASLALYLTSTLDEATPRDIPLRVALVAVATVGMFATMALLRRMPFLAVRGDRFRWTLMLVVSGVVVRGLIVGGGSAALFDGPPQVAFRVAASITTLVPLVIVTAAVVADVRTLAERRAALASARRRVEKAEQAARLEIVEAHAATVARVREVLEQAVSGAALPEVAARLREQVDTVIRPLSHQLVTSVPQWATDAQPEAPRVHWRELWRDATLGQPFRPTVIALVGFVVSILGIANRVGPLVGLAITLLLAVSTLVAFTAAKWVWRAVLRVNPGPVARLVLYLIVAMAALTGIAGAVTAAFVATGADPRPIAAAILAFGLAFSAAIACTQAAVRSVREVTADLAAETVALERAVARVQAIAWQQQRVLALAIHGPLQARIAAVAARVEMALVAGGDVSAAIADARQSVMDALDQLDVGTIGSGDVREDLLDIADAWEGVCDVIIGIDPELATGIDTDPATARVIVDVCTEACSNAIRHADAAIVEIVIEQDAPDLLRIVVTSDGRPTGTGREGLGTRLLDEVTVGWSREFTDGRTTLEALLPAPAAVAAGAAQAVV